MLKLLLLLALSLGSVVRSAENTNIIQQIDPNTIQVGAVRLQAKERRLTIPATVNMIEGQVEYLLVSAIGKLHESVLKTTAEPIHIHTAAMLLLKEQPSTNSPAQVRISVELPSGQSAPGETLFINIDRQKQIRSAPWNYIGSRISDSTFTAQRDGSIISIIADSDTLIESGRVSATDDENWRPNKPELPAVGAPVKVVVVFEGAAGAKSP